MLKKTVNLYTLLLLVTISSCTTRSKFNSIADKHKDWLSDKCSSEFPVKPDTVTSVTYRPADNINWTGTIDSLNYALLEAKNNVKYDTIYSKEDCNDKLQVQSKTIVKLTATINRLKAAYEPCKPDTVIFTNTITVPDSAALYSAKVKYEKERDARIKAEAESDSYKKDRNWLAVILGGIVLLFGVLKFMRII